MKWPCDGHMTFELYYQWRTAHVDCDSPDNVPNVQASSVVGGTGAQRVFRGQQSSSSLKALPHVKQILISSTKTVRKILF